MRRTILYCAGAILVLFLFSQLRVDDTQSSDFLVKEDALYKKVSTGFYAVDALTRAPVPFAKIVIRLKYDNDREEKRLVTVGMQYANSDGWIQVSGLEPNVTVADTYDESKSNSYIVFACDSLGKRYGRLDSIGTLGPGHYDSFTIELQPVSGEGAIQC